MNRLLAVFLFSSVVAAQPIGGQEATRLETGTSVEREIAAGEKHVYELDLSADQFVYGEADQQSVDVVVTVYDPDEEVIGTYDGPGRGREPFQFDTEKAGVHIVEVAPFEDDAGRYAVTIRRNEPVAKTSEGRVDQLMAAYDGDVVPGAVVGVIRGGQLVFARAYGMANITHGIPFTTETVTNIGSVSKQFTAFAIAVLAERGKLSLHDEVRDHISELPAFDQPVTLRHLLNHTGGYRELYNTLPLEGWHSEDEISREAVVLLVQRQPELQNAPGSEFNYNNTGYILLADVVEQVTGEPFPEWMEVNVFGPLGMDHTTIKAERGQVIPNSSQGYVTSEEGGYREAGDLDASYGSGGIYTTVGDLAKWLGNFHDARVGGPQVMARMVERGVLTDGDTIDYALGLGVGEYRGLRQISHSGADIAHRAQLIYYPELNAGVAFLSNNSSFSGRIPVEVAELFFAEHMSEEASEEVQPGDAVVVAEALLDSYVGHYTVEGTSFSITYTRDGDRFYAQTTHQPEIDLRALSDSTFAYEGIDATVTFYRNADGTVERAMHWQGEELTLRRLPPYSPSEEELQEYAGRYFSPELETFYTIVVVDGGLVAQHRELDDIELEPNSPDAFRGDTFFFGDVAFERDGEDGVTGFRVSNGRTRDILFEKQE